MATFNAQSHVLRQTEETTEIPGDATSIDVQFGVRRELGKMYQDWINGIVGRMECPVTHATLTISDLLVEFDLFVKPLEAIASELRDMDILSNYIYTLDPFESRENPLPLSGVRVVQPIWQIDPSWDPEQYNAAAEDRIFNGWYATASGGCLVVQDMWKHPTLRRNPYFSADVLYAILTNFCHPDGLIRVIMVDVDGKEDRAIAQKVYSNNGLDVGTLPVWRVHIWDYDTPEYQALLGTEVGRVVGSLLLAAYVGTDSKGRVATTKYIDKIETWWSPVADDDDKVSHASPKPPRRQLHMSFSIHGREGKYEPGIIIPTNEEEKAMEMVNWPESSPSPPPDTNQGYPMAVSVIGPPQSETKTPSPKGRKRDRTRSAPPTAQAEIRLLDEAQYANRLILPPMIVSPSPDVVIRQDVPPLGGAIGAGPSEGFDAPSVHKRAKTTYTQKRKRDENKASSESPPRSVRSRVGGGGAYAAARVATRAARQTGATEDEITAAGFAAFDEVNAMALQETDPDATEDDPDATEDDNDRTPTKDRP